MDTGIGYFATHDAAGPGEVARLVEEHGHAAIYFAEHTHIPAEPRDALRRRRGAAAQVRAHYDLFVALTAAAAATTRLRVGSGICLVVERDPIVMAKEVASVDHLSGGRLEFGVGAGWNREEMANHGTDPRTRMRLLARARGGDEGDLDPGRGLLPRALRGLRPHLVVAEAGPAATPAGARGRQRPDGARPRARLRRRLVPELRRAASVLERIPELRERAAGRRAIPVYIMSAPADARELERMRDAGVQRVVHWVPSAGRSVIERDLERFEAAVAELNGES